MSCWPRLIAAVAAALVCASSSPRAEEPSPRPDEPEFQVVGTVDGKALSLSILPRPGYRLHADAPVVVKLAGDGVALGRTLYRREDAVDPRAEAPRFEVTYRRIAAPARIDAELTFYICKAARCRPVVTRYGTSL